MRASVFFSFFLLIGVTAGGATAEPRHPLDGLESDEYARVVSLLAAAGHTDDASLFATITLEEPEKAAVLAWSPGGPFDRRAYAVVKKGADAYEAVVDLAREEVVRFDRVEGAQPAILLSEWEAAQNVTVADAGWRQAMKKRGYGEADFEAERRFQCLPLSSGYFPGQAALEGRRTLSVQCMDLEGSTTHVYARPIENLTAIVDVDEGRVIELIDDGVVPIPAANHNYEETAVGRLRPERNPTLVEQPQGANFTLEGSEITWRNWRFHLRHDKRQGTVVSMLRVTDEQGAERLVMYQGALSEVFVPYMDPARGWYFKTYMDAGEYGFGLFATTLTAGNDCPANAVFHSNLVPLDDGAPVEIPDSTCIFERNSGNPAWRHSEFLNETHESRAQVDLVVRMAATIGNYDYLLDWVFAENGEFRIDVAATGIDIVKGVEAQSMDDPTAREDTAYGVLVAPGIVGPYHDHFFSFRVDLDIDGQDNRLVRDSIVRTTLPADSPRRSLWRLERAVIGSEDEAQFDIDLDNPALWRIESSSARNAVGYPTSYHIRPVNGVVRSVLEAEDPPQARAAFSAHNLWVTRHNPGEVFAGGAFVNHSKGGDGLPQWTNGEPLDGADLVAWYTMGMRHVTTAEDWPVLPTKWFSVAFTPHNFFSRSQVIDLPDQPMVTQ